MSARKSQKDKRAALTSSILDLAGTQPPAPPAPRTRSKSIVGSALETHEQGLADRIAALEAERNAAISEGVQLIELDPDQVTDTLPSDRIAIAFQDEDFDRFKRGIAEDGQYVPILVRPVGDAQFEIAAGRRRLAACRALGRKVLARVKDLDDDAMLNLQYRENAERENISTYERALWLGEVSNRHGFSTTVLAERFGLSQPSVVEYLKMSRLPEQLIAALADPRDLTIAEARKVHAALKDSGKARIEEMVRAISSSSASDTAGQIRAALAAVADPTPKNATKPVSRKIKDARGNQIASLKSLGNKRSLEFHKSLEEGAVKFIGERLPDLIAEWRASND